jgi:anaphase-promoting complex subunit 8
MSSLLLLIPLPSNHPLMLLFQAHCLLQLNYPNFNEAFYCASLLGPDYFPNSLWIMTLRAKILFNLHGIVLVHLKNSWMIQICAEHAESEREFEKIRLLDPGRIEGLDIYSNILYLTGNKLKLSNLAHDLLAIDKDRPEVCCIVGECRPPQD